MKRDQNKKSVYYALLRDTLIILFSIIVAVVVFESRAIDYVLSYIQNAGVIGSFIAGIFFTSAFTIAPASAVFARLTETVPLLQLSLVGALGAVIGDLVLFVFVRDYVAEDLMVLMKGPRAKHVVRLFKTGVMRHLLPFCGALIIASPLPDELGLSMMGLAKTKTTTFLLISYTMNVVGILAVGLIAKAV